MDNAQASVLIVDDRPEKLLSLEAALDDLHLNIVRAYSGREALRQVLAHDLAVILLDINMPGMDGFETAQLIRQRASSAHVPIIFLTALGDEMYVARGYSLGAVDYLLTPVVPQVLRSKVAVFVDLFRKTQQVQLQAERLRQRATQLHRLTSASLAINSAPTVQKIVQIVTETARELIGVHQAMTIIAAPHHPIHATGFISCSNKHEKYPPRTPRLEDHSLFGLICATNKPMRMTPQELEAHAPGLGSDYPGPPLEGLLAAPLNARTGENMGLVLLTEKVSGEFTEDDQAIVVQLAQMASVAIENTIFAEEREANRLKDEFLSTLSHELRTPLNAISGWVHLLRLEPLEGEMAHGLEVIERNVSAQTKLIEDLLDLSRITSGKLRLNARPTGMKQIVEAAVDAIRPIVQEKGVTLDSQITAEDAVVVGDPDRLQQVLWNLLTNAAKFTPGGGRIAVRLQREGGAARIAVADTGHGIEKEFLPYVFDRFRQADSSSSRHHGGLGIGLTIVQHIINLHHGSVRADSEGRGRGATFTITLPLSAVTESAAHSTDPGCNGNSLPSLKNIRVLVVDDEPDAREVVAQMLQRCDAEVQTASGASEAIRLFSQRKPDILVTDLAMPDRDGFWLLREIRRLPNDKGGNTPAVALTAYARPEDQAQAFESGFQAHLTKPIDPAELIETVHRCAPKPLEKLQPGPMHIVA